MTNTTEVRYVHPEANEKLRKEFVRLYKNEGMTLEEIAARYNCCVRTVERYLIYEGCPRRRPGPRRRLTRKQHLEVIKLHQRGTSVKELALKYGIAQSTMYAYTSWLRSLESN